MQSNQICLSVFQMDLVGRSKNSYGQAGVNWLVALLPPGPIWSALKKKKKTQGDPSSSIQAESEGYTDSTVCFTPGGP